MLFERLIPTEDCSLCELQDICNIGYVSIPSYSVVTCEAFKNAVREYGGKDKILTELYDQINRELPQIKTNQEFSMEILNKYIEGWKNYEYI